MFDRSSNTYRQLIADIAEAVSTRVDARILTRIDAKIQEIDRRVEAARSRSQPAPKPQPQWRVPALPPGILSTLTPRERQVLEGIVGGGSNKTIARTLGISDRTVEVHRARVMEKLEVQGTAALITAAVQAGILPDGSGTEEGAEAT